MFFQARTSQLSGTSDKPKQHGVINLLSDPVAPLWLLDSLKTIVIPCPSQGLENVCHNWEINPDYCLHFSLLNLAWGQDMQERPFIHVCLPDSPLPSCLLPKPFLSFTPRIKWPWACPVDSFQSILTMSAPLYLQLCSTPIPYQAMWFEAQSWTEDMVSFASTVSQRLLMITEGGEQKRRSPDKSMGR